jgi:hypothetical protein
VSGVVAIETTNAVQAGLRVQVLAFERRRGAFVVGETLTDEDGAFSPSRRLAFVFWMG